jgi:hypothetical protein
LLLRWRLGFLWMFNSGLGGVFSLAVDSWAFSGELVWFVPSLGEGKQTWEHFAHQPCGRSIRPYIFSLGCEKCSLPLPLRVQECRPLTPWDAGMIWLLGVENGILICLRSPDPTNPLSETSTQLLLGIGKMTHLPASCWQWGSVALHRSNHQHIDEGWPLGSANLISLWLGPVQKDEGYL